MVPYIIIILLLLPGLYPLQWLKVNTKTQHIVNTDGATVVLHGVNVVYKVPPWIPDTSQWDPITSFTEKDINNLLRWGFNVVRLGVMWPGVRPRKGWTNETYLGKIDELVTKLGEKGIYTILDLHQDLFSRYYCGEGVPDFLLKDLKHTHEFPWPAAKPYKKDPITGYPSLEDCLSIGHFSKYYFTESVCDAFALLYDSNSELYKELEIYWTEIAKRFGDNPNVLGYDLINEPMAGHEFRDPFNFFDPFGSAGRRYLEPLYHRLHNAIRRYDQRHIILYEWASNNYVFTSGLEQAPGGPEYSDRQLLSYHIYCLFLDSTRSPHKGWEWLCELQESFLMYLKSLEIKRFGCGGIMTEFGAATEAEGSIAELHRVIDKADQLGHGFIYWQYKYYNDLTTSNKNKTGGLYYPDSGKLQTKKLRALTRPFARKVAGMLKSMRFNVKTGKFELKYRVSEEVSETTTEIYVNKGYYNGKVPKITANPKNVRIEVEDVERKEGEVDEFVKVLITHGEGWNTGIELTITLSN